jgi:hypothetical protein
MITRRALISTGIADDGTAWSIRGMLEDSLKT